MATKKGRRYPLVVYSMMLGRWWTAVFTLGLALLGLAWGIRSWGFEEWRWQLLAGIGVFFVLVGLVILIIKNFAYVQPFGDHLRLVTPFLRLNISYKRIRRTSSANMGSLFPPSSVSSWRKEIIEPIAKMTAIVIELNAFPISRNALLLFLSPLFFKDKTPHIVILVNDWMRFSSELESMRTSGNANSSVQARRDTGSILSKLPKNK
ncbi:MAG: hypothetical protein U0Z26_13165 [Anaerolineales bacterium]